MDKSVWLYGITTIVFLLISNSIEAQTYTLGSGGATGTVTTCTGTFYDPGGSGSNYSDDLDYSITFSTGDPTKVMVLDFTSWNLENNSNCSWDYLEIYDGTNSSAPLIGKFCTNAPGESVIATGQSLHFVFHSDGSVTESGWVATISCIDLPCEYGDYSDEFASSNYSLSNGSLDWTSDSWTESNDDGSASSGNIRITGGELRFNNSSSGRSIQRDIDMTGAATAILSFDIRESGGHETSDNLVIDIYDGSSWNTVYTSVDDFPDASPQIDISDYAFANSKIRITADNHASNEYIYIDNLEICYSSIFGGSSTLDFTLEAECGYIGSSWSTFTDASASNGFYLEPKSGSNSLGSAPADTLDYLTYTVEIDSSGDYELFARIKAPTGSDDSFWVRANAGTWYRWNGLSPAASWTWTQVWDSDNSDALVSFTLSEGTNRIDFAYREDGTQLDKLHLTLNGSAPSGMGSTASNCPALMGLDTDKDGIVDEDDIDDDNDGILDVDESPASIDFSGVKTLIVGSNGLTDMRVGDVVVYDNAVRSCDDIFFDVTIEINFRSPGVTVEAGPQGMLIKNAGADQDDYFTFTLSVVESGSATAGSPSGTAATITDFLFTPRDIDSNDAVDHTEVFGIRNTTAPDTTFLDDNTVLEQGGFVNGGGAGVGYTYYRMIPLSGVNDWTVNGNDVTGELVEHAVYMFYENFSTVDIAYGRTGSANSSNAGTRLTSLFASSECDRDDDGIPNRVDLDLDNDGIFDLYEAGHGELDANDDGRIDSADVLSGPNGLFDDLETSSESGSLNYTYSSSDTDGVEDAFDLDSDGDGCFDTEEANVADGEPDGTAGSGTATSDANGLVVSVIYQEPPTGAWQDSLASCLEICDNGLDDDGDGDIDEFDADCANYYLEAECAFPGDNWDKGLDTLASNNDYLTISPGLNSEITAPAAAADLIRFTVNVTAAGLYRILARVYSVTGADDSFWIRVDEATWYNWNDWNTASTWQWLPVTDNDNGNTLVKFPMSIGNHTIDIAYREDGARVDKLHLTINGTTPTDEGEDAINCGRVFTPNLFLPQKLLNK